MLLIAHGGYSSNFPENTKIAYEKALEYKPDGLEMDVAFYNHEVYFYHPVGNVNSFGLDVDQLIEEQLKAILKEDSDILSFKDVITLNSYLKNTKFLYFDIKQKNEIYTTEILNRIMKLSLSKEQVLIGVREIARVQDIRKATPNVTLVSLDQDPSSYTEYLKSGVEYIRIWYKDLSEEIIQDIHQKGGKVIVNHKMPIDNSLARDTGNYTKELLLELEAREVDGVLINDIKLGRDVIKFRG